MKTGPWGSFSSRLGNLLIGAFLDLESLGATSDVESVPSLVAQITVFQEFLP